MMEGKITEWWSKSSRGTRRSFDLLKTACELSKKINRVHKRFQMFTSRKFVRLCIRAWKVWFERRVGHIKRKKPRNLLRVKSRMVSILLAWRTHAHKECLARWRYVESVQRRFLYLWKTNVTEGAEEKVSVDV